MKQEFKYGGGYATILMSLRTGRLYDAETDQARLRADGYDIRQYYTSCSGLSGAGTIAKGDDLVECGVYRTDTRTHLQYGRTLRGISIYAPQGSHKGMDHSMPCVLSKSNRIALCRQDDIMHNIVKWDSLNWGSPEKLHSWYPSGSEFNNDYWVYNAYGHVPHYFLKPGYLARFLDLVPLQRDWSAAPAAVSVPGALEQILAKIGLSPMGEYAYDLGQQGIPIARYSREEISSEAWEYRGWKWYSHQEDCDCLSMIRREGEYMRLIACGGLVEIDEIIDLIDWFAAPAQGAAIIARARLSLAQQELERLACEPLDVNIYINMCHAHEGHGTYEDAIGAGLCADGVRQFQELHGLELPVKMSSLPDHPAWAGMIQDRYFRLWILAICRR